MEPESEPTKSRINYLKIFGLIVADIVLILVATWLGYIAGLKNKPNNTSSPNPPIVSKLPDNDSGNYPELEKIYPSLDQAYYFYVVYPQGGDDIGETKCKFGISGERINTKYLTKYFADLVGYYEITCSQGMGGFYNTFIRWAEDDRLLIMERKGTMNIYQVSTNTLKNYFYNPDEIEFQSVDKSLKYWLFSKKDQKDKRVFTVLDGENNTVVDNLTFGVVDRPVLYDDLNDGFLFIGRYYENNLVSVRFDWLGIKDVTTKNLLTTDSISVPGRGCYPEYLVSKPGEVIVTPGCLTVAEKYLGADGNIHLPL